MSKWLRLLIIMVIIGIAKTHHIIRVVILAALGLAGLWMLHTLAQDFNKIFHNFQNNNNHNIAPTIPKSLFAKRSINNSNYYLVNEATEAPEQPQVDWERVLSRDPVGCARSFVCQLVAANPEELPSDESNILLLIRSSTQRNNWANKQLQNALNYGQQVSSPSQCRNQYRFCPYSKKTMMSLLRLFGGT